MDLMYELPSMTGLKEVVVNEKVVDGSADPLFIYEDSEKTAG